LRYRLKYHDKTGLKQNNCFSQWQPFLKTSYFYNKFLCVIVFRIKTHNQLIWKLVVFKIDLMIDPSIYWVLLRGLINSRDLDCFVLIYFKIYNINNRILLSVIYFKCTLKCVSIHRSFVFRYIQGFPLKKIFSIFLYV